MGVGLGWVISPFAQGNERAKEKEGDGTMCQRWHNKILIFLMGFFQLNNMQLCCLGQESGGTAYRT